MTEGDGVVKKAGRAWCDKCGRAASVCICDSLPAGAPFRTETEVVVLVHPKEVKRKCGTLPLLRACLQDLRVVEGDKFPEPDVDPALHEELTRGGRRCALVCPGENAKPPEEFLQASLGPDGRPLPLALILIDGTWAQATGMIRKSKWLREIPRVVLNSTEHSGYKFRQQPQEGCLSTLEAVGEALANLEGDHGRNVKAGLKSFFAAMVNTQVSFIPDVEKIDKNAPGGREAFFQAQVQHSAQTVEDRAALPRICICRWGEKYNDNPATPQKRMHVERVLKGVTGAEAEEILREANRSAKRGAKLFLTKYDKLPEDTVRELSQSEAVVPSEMKMESGGPLAVASPRGPDSAWTMALVVGIALATLALCIKKRSMR